jgi:hypothetical protein
MQAATIDAFRVLNVVTAGILVGVISSETFLILPHVRRLPPRDGVNTLRFFGERAWILGPGCGATAFGAAVVLIALGPWHRFSAASVLTIAGLLLWASAIVVTFTVYLPTDRRYRNLAISNALSESSTELRRLGRANALRYALYFAGFAAFAAAAAT